MSTLPFDVELARRYSVPGPRYTSYPTANQFHADFGALEYRQSVQRSNEDPIPKPLSLYVHVPFCENPCFYCGCTRIITRDHTLSDRYVAALIAEIRQQAALFDADRPLTQLHFGGGTPSFLSHGQLGAILNAVAEYFNVPSAETLECSIEVDPRTVAPADLSKLRAIGFNRISLGIQDFDLAVQRAVNRVQSVEHTAGVIASARAAHFASINVDLIYGLPKQTLSGFENTLEQVIALGPDRIAAYSYAHLPHLFRAQNQIHGGDLPAPETKLSLLASTVTRLTEAGYIYIGMDHFALPTDELARAARTGALRRNFQGYSTQAECDIIGVGMSAISAVGDCYAQNQKFLPEYYRQIEHNQLATARGVVLSDDDQIRRAVIERLLCNGVVDYAWFERQFQEDFRHYFETELSAIGALQRDGIVKLSDSMLQLTPVGRYLMRAPAMCFDRYLQHAMAVTPFSKIV